MIKELDIHLSFLPFMGTTAILVAAQGPSELDSWLDSDDFKSLIDPVAAVISHKLNFSDSKVLHNDCKECL